MLDNNSDNSPSTDGNDNSRGFDHEAFIDSGVLELYVYGIASDDEVKAVHAALKLSGHVREALLLIELVAEELAQLDAVAPDPIIKPFLLSTIDLQDRMMAGEVLLDAPLLNERSVASDFSVWLDRGDIVPPAEIDGIFAKIISANATAMTAIVWITEMAPQEVHHDQYERFLILEGTCDIVVEENIYPLQAGNFFQIPLHKSHEVIITSEIPCKVILQRVAA
ncbi:cupin domain-containing protein [Pedobacter duraquae]|uniref:Cupin domain-containing protein n=1 Tax=Pedobacter duraquae TaxID=425511 RepID=A0A4V3C2N5_9SPHI|nr:cupin domain-containing protein [Pedobacter duraquae]TDO19089.1 Cupin domain-containing protein [Pedobacter duraquae]